MRRALVIAVVALLCCCAGAAAEVVQQGDLRVKFEGEVSPMTLPREGAAPVTVSLGAQITTTDHKPPPQLRRIEIAINRNGRLDPDGLPVCRRDDIQPATTRDALQACRDSLVGEGEFSANVTIPEQSPFPSTGEVTVFNGVEDGRPVMFAHVYGTDPVPTSYTLPLRIGHAKGTFGTVLSASLPQVTSKVAYVTGLSLELKRTFRYRGHPHSYFSAGCPAPKGFPGAVFPFARASFSFAGGKTLSSTLTRHCRARGR